MEVCRGECVFWRVDVRVCDVGMNVTLRVNLYEDVMRVGCGCVDLCDVGRCGLGVGACVYV